MKLIRQSCHVFLLLLLILFTLSPLNVMAESKEDQSLNYVALGDSLAAGVLSDNSLGSGYPVFIKDGIKKEHGYDVTLINEGVPGYTTTQVLEQLKDNDNNVRNALENADLITIDAGANDLLQAVDIENIDPENPGETIKDVQEVIKLININMSTILKEINEVNPNAPIYVMGYYNAMPYLEGMQDLIELAVGMMNDTIQASTENGGAIYIPTFASFEGNYETYLPNPENIHPNEVGHQVIADEFLDVIIPIKPLDRVKPEIKLLGDNPLKLVMGEKYEDPGSEAEDNIDGDLSEQIGISGEVNTNKPGEYTVTYTVTDAAGNTAKATRLINVVEPDHITVAPGDKTDVSRGETVTIAGTDTEVTMPLDLPDGTSLEIHDASESEKVTGAEGLALAGDVYNFKLSFPSEAGGTTGSYTLQMEYDAGKFSADQVAIYDYHLDSGEWEKKNGTVDEIAGTITLETPHLSTYGVFIEANNDKNQNGNDGNTGQENNDSDLNGDCKCEKEDTGETENYQDKTEKSTYEPVEEGGELPDTATSNPLMILIGSLMALTGGILLAVRGKLPD